MNNKIIGLLVCTLLIITSLPTISGTVRELSNETNADDIKLNNSKSLDDFSSLSMFFTENQGQFPNEVLFQTHIPEATVYLCKDKLVTVFTRTNEEKQFDTRSYDETSIKHKQLKESRQLEMVSIVAKFVDANPDTVVIGGHQLPHKNNYFIGNDPAQWYTDVPNYQSVIYKDIYPSIDLIYYSNGGLLKYDFIVNPGTDPSQIAIKYEGADSIQMTSEGDLKIITRLGSIYEEQPVIYQEIDGVQQQVTGSYLLNDDVFSFIVEEPYNQEYPLIIDPGLLYSTYLGGSFYNVGQSIAVDSSGCAYVAGWTASTDFPIENPYDDTYNGGYCDVFVTKFSPEGDTLIYSTYLGGSGDGEDNARRITIDSSGCAYMTGYTYSHDFPMQNPYDDTLAGECDVFVTKLSASGNALIYSTYIGGTGEYGEYGGCIAVDSNDYAYISGWSYSNDFPMENPFDGTFNAWEDAADAFVTKLSPQGNTLIYSTYLGGSIHQYCECIAVDSSGCAYVSGMTYSHDFPMQNPYDDTYDMAENQEETFVTKFSPQGNTLEYSTYLGGDGEDIPWSIVVDNNDCAYVTGQTGSSDFPIVNPYDDTYNGGYCDIYVTKFSPQGNTLKYSTYIGGTEKDYGCFIAVDNNNCAYITGATDSSDFPTEYPFDDTHNGLYDAFVTKLSSQGNKLVYSTYLGGSSGDWGNGIFVDSNDCAYVAGHTRSSDFPVKNPFDSTLDSDRDAFVTKFPKGGGNSVAYIISDRAELSVSIAGNKMMVSSLFLRFLEHFPNAFPILRHIQGL